MSCKPFGFEDIDLAAGLIHVRRSWDSKAGPVKPKSAKGTRKVPVPAVLRDLLVEHRMRHPDATGLAFGRTATTPFSPSAVTELRPGGLG